MSHYNRLCLAGLDAMVLTSLRSSVPEDVHDANSYVTVATADIKRAMKAGRHPLTDKTPDLNTSVLFAPSSKNSKTTSLVEPTVPRKLKPSSNSTRLKPHPVLTYKSLPAVPTLAPPRPASDRTVTPSSSSNVVSKPLPSLPSPSSTSSSRPTSPTTGHVDPRPPSPLLEPPQPSLPEALTHEIHDDPYEIPLSEHPNSPYVPWSTAAPPRKISSLKAPKTPLSQSCSVISVVSNFSSHRRSGARAPEPPEDDDDDDDAQLGAAGCMGMRKGKGKAKMINLRRSLKNLRHVVKKNVTSIVSKPLSKLKTRPNPPEAPLPTNLSSPISVDLTHRSVSDTASEASVVSYTSSAGTTTLAGWLADRRRASMERERETQQGGGLVGMSLEEYEQTGSWLDLPRSSESTEDYYDDELIANLTDDLNSPLDFTEESYFMDVSPLDEPTQDANSGPPTLPTPEPHSPSESVLTQRPVILPHRSSICASKSQSLPSFHRATSHDRLKDTNAPDPSSSDNVSDDRNVSLMCFSDSMLITQRRKRRRQAVIIGGVLWDPVNRPVPRSQTLLVP